MKFNHHLILLVVVATGAVRAEDHEQKKDSLRRFKVDLDEKEWHIAHLMDTEYISRRSGCDEPFENRVKRYKDALRRDAGRIQYVSSNPLPDTPQKVRDPCFDIGDGKNSGNTTISTSIAQPTRKYTSKNTDQKNTENANKSDDGVTVEDEPSPATTSKIPVSRANKTSARRASEYQFSSVEYYDETVDFTVDALCPDAVEEIILEQDVIRNYDLECQLTLEWKSLDGRSGVN